jgi:beta-glucosidase
MMGFRDSGLSVDDRVKDLLGRLTLEEKVSQMTNDSRAIARLGIPEYDWWNECLHGVGRAGTATVFPQVIGLAATFDAPLVREVANATSDEARAKHHEFLRQGYRRQYHGLSFFTPNVNIFRDPRWGRGQETWGEDPYLTGRMGVAFIKGLQGPDPRHPKVLATAKHFAVHSGPEALRHVFDAHVSLKDLRETYLPAFHACVVEGEVRSVMGAYNRVNGELCCASPTLLTKVLREEWGFDGFVVSDCGAIEDFHARHTITATKEQSAALAVKSGCDLECGWTYPCLVDAVRQGLLTESDIDVALMRVLRARFQLGLFDPSEQGPYETIPYEVVDCEEHRAIALRAARESIVLLKNEKGLLPLRKNLSTIAMIGPNADSREALLGNYNGFPSEPITLLEGIRAVAGESTNILYAKGCELAKSDDPPWGEKTDSLFPEALAAAERADAVVLCLGLSNALEGEQGDSALSDWQGDRIRIELPRIQERLLQAVVAKNPRVALVVMSGSPVAIPWAHEHVPAILEAWYPGQAGGRAIAEALFGDVNPAGRLPVTFVRSVDQLPPFVDYDMKGRTYRYLTQDPLYPFGFGLSYTRFEYSDLRLAQKRLDAGSEQTLAVAVHNVGARAGDEVVQLYLRDLEASVRVPLRQLVGFARIRLDPGESREVRFVVSARQMALIDEAGRCVLEPGMFRLSVGGRQPDPRSALLSGTAVCEADFEVTGRPLVMPF